MTSVTTGSFKVCLHKVATIKKTALRWLEPVFLQLHLPFTVSCTSKLIFIVKPLYNISSVGTRLRSGGNKQKRDETAKNRQAKQAECGLGRGEGGRAPSSLSLPRLSRSPILFAFPPTSEPGPRPLCITHKLIGDIHSSLLLFITCKLHQKQSGKGTLSIVAKRSLKIPEGTA